MKSLKAKFTLTTITIIFLSFLIAFLLSNSYYQQKLKPDNDQKNTEIALQMVQYAEKEQTLALEDYLQHIASIGYHLMLIDEHGQKQFFGDPFRDESLPEEIVFQVINGEVYHGMALLPQETFVTGFFANELKNTIGVPLRNNEQSYALFMRPNIKLLFNEMHILFGLLLFLTIALCIIFVIITTTFLIDPISKLTRATRQITDGNFSIKLEIDRNDEIGELAKSFTQMAHELGQLDEMKNEFISNISHDIQSPLSNIKGYTDLLSKEALTETEKLQYTKIINDEITRLSDLTKELLLLASLDRIENLLKKKPFQLSAQIKELIRHYQWRLNEKGIMISYSLPDVTVVGDPSLLYTVWDNLISNGIKYNKQNGSLEIIVHEENDCVEVHFRDSGIGMTIEDIGRIFDRFYRADSARTRTIEGTGLGLSIAATIIKLHDGQIEVTSSKEKGTHIVVRLQKIVANK